MTATVRPIEGTLTARFDEAARLVAGVLEDLQPELLVSSEATTPTGGPTDPRPR
jgi:hypothetical protein